MRFTDGSRDNAGPPATKRVVKRVVKVGGRVQSDPRLATQVAHVWNSGVALCLVHGGGDEISALQRKFGTEPKFAGGRRITTREDIELIRMALSGAANKRLVARLKAVGVRAVGISGEDGSLIGAQPLGVTEFGHVGVPCRIDTSVVEVLWGGGFLPVVSPLASDADAPAEALNVNGDDAAAALAIALVADELVFVADVDGVLDASGLVISDVEVDEARALISAGVANAGMAAKLEAAHVALAGGVASVCIAGISGIGNSKCGTHVTLSVVGAR